MFKETDFGKPITNELAEYLRAARQDDYIEAGIKAGKSFETVKGIATRRRNLLERNANCVTELIKILKSREIAASKDIKKFTNA